jgi:hypothetical protein
MSIPPTPRQFDEEHDVLTTDLRYYRIVIRVQDPNEPRHFCEASLGIFTNLDPLFHPLVTKIVGEYTDRIPHGDLTVSEREPL